MKRKIVCVILSLILVSALTPVPPAQACGPFFTVTVFIQRIHPDLPLKKYAAGELGIVPPSYPNSYLVAAYRYFVGKGFDATEQQQLVTLWDKRLQIGEFTPDWLTDPTKSPKQVLPVHEWFRALQEVIGKEPREFPNSAELPSSYVAYHVCGDDAFRTAAATLRARAKEFGPRSEATQEWADAQNTVFLNCGGAQGQSGIPVPAPAQLPAKIRADREYQIAAAYFYAGDWDDAENRFLAIAQNPNSPWQKVAAIVAVRCRIRQATLENEDPAKIREQLEPAEARLEQLDADSDMREMKPAIHRLKGFVEFRTDPDRYAKELAKILANDDLPGSLMQDLEDYTRVLDVATGDIGAYYDNPHIHRQAMTKFGPLEKLREGNDLTDWLFTFEAEGKEAEQHALARWEETKSPAWLVAALSKVTKDSPKREELLQEAGKVQRSSKAYYTVQFHRLRVLEEIGKSEEARAGLDTILSAKDVALPVSARNTFLALRMKAAANFDDFLKHALRRPSAVSLDMDGLDLPAYTPEESCRSLSQKEQEECLARGNPGPLLDSDAGRVFTSELTTEMLLQAAKSPHLNARAQKAIAQAAFARAALLKKDAEAKEAALTLSSLSASLKASLSGYLAAKDEDEKQFLAALFLLQHPEFHPDVTAGLGRERADGEIDSFRYNWWCAYGPRAQGDYDFRYNEFYTPWNEPLRTIYPDEASLSPRFLSANQKGDASQEWNALLHAPSGVVWLGDQVLAYAKVHADDARVPQALHLVVRASRYGCFDVETGRVSKSAFQLLHRKYPSSEWTKETPYWFGAQQ
jgi:hypothetical protein